MSSFVFGRRTGAVLVAAVVAATSAGCGLGAGRAPGKIQLTVTRDFGARVLGRSGPPRVSGQETVMSLLLRNDRVTTKYGGGFVQSIGGLSGGQEGGGDPVDWFYYVNGVEAAKGAAATNVHAGDHVWWDRHDWGQTDDVPAVVGSFPEPFLHGVGGKRLPVRVECAEAQGDPCRTVTARLRALGVPAAVAGIGSGSGRYALQVVVGRWTAVHGDPSVQSLERGPRASGVYARFATNGQVLTLLDQKGRATSTLGAGTGLIAATRDQQGAIVWVVSGTDEAGTESAARALRESALRNRFALATRATSVTAGTTATGVITGTTATGVITGTTATGATAGTTAAGTTTKGAATGTTAVGSAAGGATAAGTELSVPTPGTS
jgi:hypothetical protein